MFTRCIETKKKNKTIILTGVTAAKLALEAGIPAGVFNVVHGKKPTVDFMCDHKHIQAVSFVGSNRVGEYLYQRASNNNKRVQANLGAKNHCIVLPDADKLDTLKQLVGAGFGAAGQRCMVCQLLIHYLLIDEKQKNLTFF